jgi:putative ABC transport system substrate-binding protein
MQFNQPNRRQLMTLLSGAAAWPLGARAQQGVRMPVLGYLTDAKADPVRLATFRSALASLGYVEGKNISIEVGAAKLNSDYDLLATEFVSHRVDIIIGQNATATNAARKATSTIPIVMTAVNDPVEWGFVDSLEHPGKNITGTTLTAPQLVGERLRILRRLVPGLDKVSMLLVPSNAANPPLFALLNAEARRLNIETQALNVRLPQDIGLAFDKARAWGAKALLHANDIFINTQRFTIAKLAEQNRLPVIYADGEYVKAGGLMSLGPGHRQGDVDAAKYVDKILRGASPATLSIALPTEFIFAASRSRLKELGIHLPEDLESRITEWLD